MKKPEMYHCDCNATVLQLPFIIRIRLNKELYLRLPDAFLYTAAI